MFCRNESKLLLICALLACSTLSYGQDEATNDVTKKTTATIPTTIATSTTEKPETTTTTTTTSTPKPTTRSTTSTTTTTTTTTPTPPPTTTTVKPSPTPPPEPEMGTWITGCIIVQMAAKFNLTYETKDNKTANATINLPESEAHIDVTSSCGNTTQQLVLEWGPNTSINSLLIQFEKNGTDFVLYELRLKISIAEGELPNSKDQNLQLTYIGNSFVTPISRSYHCTKALSFPMNPVINDPEIVGYVILSKLQLEAFRTKASDKFSSAIDCEGAETNDVVPIAVGIALISLVLVVLISYLFARRRSTARGYMSF